MAVASDMRIEIEEVVLLNQEVGPLLAHNLEAPTAGFSSQTPAIPIEGWALEPSGSLEEVHVRLPFIGLKKLRPDQPRSDIATAFGEVEGAMNSGYGTYLSTVGLPTEFEITVVGVLRNGAEVPLAAIRGTQRKRIVLARGLTDLSPLLVTTLGRSGSTWLVRLLAAHPQLLAYRPFEFEPRLVTYWTEIVRSLTDPAIFCSSIDGRVDGEAWWAGNEHAAFKISQHLDPEIRELVGQETPSELLAFARDRVEASTNGLPTCSTSPSQSISSKRPSRRSSRTSHPPCGPPRPRSSSFEIRGTWCAPSLPMTSGEAIAHSVVRRLVEVTRRS